uniref:Zinc transporter ZIP3 n=1 Tax=Elaeophora elaphi TaxID=1147741 RepID=A0A0R3RZ93_9BILA
MNEFTMQIICAIAMLLTTAIAGFAPFKLMTMIASNGVMSRRASVILSVMSCYAGGVFLATCFLDTLPHLNENFRKFKKITAWDTSYPVPEFLVCIGILSIYVLEEIFAWIFSKTKKSEESVKGMEMLKLAKHDGKKLEQETESLREYRSVETKDIEGNGEIVNSDIEVNNRRSRSNSNLASGIIHSITFTIAMSFHSILEGVALGVQDEKFGIITLFVSLLLHKGIEAFSVGLQISRTIAQKVKIVIATITIYSLMTPIGSFAGLFLQNVDMNESWRQGIILVLEGLAIGTFIFVTFLEVLYEQRNDSKAIREEIIAIALGVLTISGFQYFEGSFRTTGQNIINSDSAG